MFFKRKDDLDVLNEELKTLLEEAEENVKIMKERENNMSLGDKTAKVEMGTSAKLAADTIEIVRTLGWPYKEKYFKALQQMFDEETDIVRKYLDRIQKMMEEDNASEK